MKLNAINISKPLIQDSKRFQERIEAIPNEFGCYMMLDKNRNILYIGKSKQLRSRVRSYFRPSNELSPRIRLMVRQIDDIDIIVTDSEAEALTLESNLIKSNQPYFNVLLKDDKKYPYLCITWSEKYPRIFITRRRRQRNFEDRFYGPFVDVGLLRKTLFLVKRSFPLRQRPIPLYKDRTCLNYQIKRCPGVCQKEISPEDYRETIRKVAMVFQGRSDELQQLLNEQMDKFASKLEYERAAEVRDQINALNQVQQEQKMIIPDSSISRDVLAISSDQNVASVQLFQMRSGKLVGRIGYTSDSKGIETNIVLQKLLEEHYSQVDPIEIPSEILVQHSLPNQAVIVDWISEVAGKKVHIMNPKRGSKAELVELVYRNANLELSRIIKGHQKVEIALDDLATLLQLDIIPRRIEGYDISHIQGSDAVASQVVFIDGIPAKQHYRKYKIKSSEVTLGHSDDYMSLAEVLGRRLRKWSRFKSQGGDIKSQRFSKPNPLELGELNDWPDLIMIDGGKGQLSSVMNVVSRLGLEDDLHVCSLAKQNEDVFLPGLSIPLESESNQPALILLRQLRDEAHRFALSFHRKRRAQRMKRSRLGDIPGLGPKRIKDLLAHFNSVEAIAFASLKDIKELPGFGEEMALNVWNYFHSEE